MTDTLLNTSHRYIDFVNRIARGDTFDQMGESTFLLSSHCKKVFNGNLLMEDRESFVADLISVHQNYGGWKLVPLDIIDASADNAIVLRILIKAESFGTNTAIVILRFDENGLIAEINEVFSPVKDRYEFETK